MTTEAQISANRSNAHKSTGPRTPEGKAVVAQNAIKHGLLAQDVIIKGEDPGQFELYRDGMLAELAPAPDLPQPCRTPNLPGWGRNAGAADVVFAGRASRSPYAEVPNPPPSAGAIRWVDRAVGGLTRGHCCGMMRELLERERRGKVGVFRAFRRRVDAPAGER